MPEYTFAGDAVIQSWLVPRVVAAGAAAETASLTISISTFINNLQDPTTFPNVYKYQADDIWVLLCETSDQTVSTPTGFTELTGSPFGSGSATTRLTVFWRRITSSESDIVIGDPGDHVLALFVALRGTKTTGDPFNVTSGGFQTPASTALTASGATTSVPNTLVLAAASRSTDIGTSQFSNWENADLQGFAEIRDFGTTAGNGGGVAFATGIKVTPGAYGNSTATVATSTTMGWTTIAFEGMPGLTKDTFFSADSFFIPGFNANAVLANSKFLGNAVLKKTISPTFTGNSVLEPYRLVRFVVFPGDAVLKSTKFRGFYADAWLIGGRVSAAFTADAALNVRTIGSFQASAIIRKPAVATPSALSKTIRLTVAQRRPLALSAFVPPRELDPEPEPETIPDCLPPCPSDPSGVGTGIGTTGSAVRTTIVYCANCGGNFFESERNQLGKDGPSGDSSPSHAGCSAGSHFFGDHKYRIWVAYPSFPAATFALRAKLRWRFDSTAPNMAVRVFGNVTTPSIVDFEPWSDDFFLNEWNGGTHLGDLAFAETAGGAVDGGPTYRVDETPAEITIDPTRLSTTTLRFELSDEGNFTEAKLYGSTVEIL